MRPTTLIMILFLVVACATPDASGPRDEESELDVRSLTRFARLALDSIHREYPNKISHVMQGPEDVAEPHELTPMFYGSYDWHSAVHGHWLLVRLCRTAPDAPFTTEARVALARSFTPARAAAEVAYLNGEGRGPFERPYGLAWLLQLDAELHEWDDVQAREWARALAPLTEIAATRLAEWFPKLTHPIRTGEHSQTAFAMGLVLDWARSRGRSDLERLVAARGRDYYLGDRGWNMAFEPGGQDFLSPGLAEADFVRRLLAPRDFAAWLEGFLPGIPVDAGATWLAPARVTDKSDGKLAHLDGLNLARAWMLDGIVVGLPDDDPRRRTLETCRDLHARVGLAAVTGEDYSGGHWLGSFAVYLVTRRGVVESSGTPRTRGTVPR